MKKFSSNKFGRLALFFLAVCPALSAAEIQINQLLPPATVAINFDRDIRPILETSCLRCHGPEKPRSHFRLDNRAAALNGGDENTNDIVPGDSSNSFLIKYVARQVADMEMPPEGKGSPLTPEQIALLRAWIDQGVNWSTTNQPPQFTFDFAPTIRVMEIQGDKSKFRELEGANDGLSGGVEHFSVVQQISPDEKLSLDGHATFPDRDIELKLALDKTDVGFVHAGFEEWQKYYNGAGGYNSVVIPSEFNLNRDLHVDNGRVWIDFGLALSHRPQVVLGYEYDFKNGDKSMLDWGYANGKDIYPATLAVDEQTHIIKLDVTHDFDDWHLEDQARGVFYSSENTGAEGQIYFGGTLPDAFISTRDNYHSAQGMDTLTLEKQIRDWWFMSGGFYYSKLESDDFFSQTTALPVFNFNNSLESQQITLRRESEIFSVASLFTPLKCLTLSLGSQNEWTKEEGFGSSVPDLELAVNAPANSSLNLFKSDQNVDVRFMRIPFTVLFADVRFEQESVDAFLQENGDEFLSQNDAVNQCYNVQTGFNTSPWRWFALNVQYQKQSSETDFNNPTDVVNGVPGETNGYPGFITSRKIQTDGFETKLDLRPASWLKTTLTYRISDTDYYSKTHPAFDPGLMQTVSLGSPITDGRYTVQTYGFGATLTPVQRLYFSGVFSYSHSRTVTAGNGDPSIVPYCGDIYTLTATATYALNAKTVLQTSYAFSRADYGENDASAGMPLGLDFTRHELIVGLTRQITRRLSGTLRYQFSQYSEPSSGNANNFTAQGVFATLAYKWP